MHMNIEITLRLMITPVTPIVNNTADSARYHESCGSILLLSLLRIAQCLNAEQPRGFVRLICPYECQVVMSNCRINQRQVKVLRAQNDARVVRQQSATAGERHRADDRHQQQYLSDLKRQQVTREQHRSDR